jgi:probable Rubsico expression protein CbbX
MVPPSELYDDPRERAHAAALDAAGTASSHEVTPAQAEAALTEPADPGAPGGPGWTVDLAAEFEASGIGEVLDSLDRDLVGLAPVKRRVREIAALLLVERMRERVGLSSEPPSLHMSFTGNPGTGKTTVAMRMAEILHRLGYVRKGHVIAVTRDDLVGQYIGHTAPKTKEVLKKAMGGVLFIDEAYYLYRPENEKDYGQEAIEILLQVMENQRDDLVVIMAGYEDRMQDFFGSNPGISSRIAHHIEFPDYTDEELIAIADLMLADWNYRFEPGARQAFREYLDIRRTRPHFANARSVRNALDRIRLRQALRLFEDRDHALTPDDLVAIREPEVRGSRLFETVADDDRYDVSPADDAAESPAPRTPAPDPFAPDQGGGS